MAVVGACQVFGQDGVYDRSFFSRATRLKRGIYH